MRHKLSCIFILSVLAATSFATVAYADNWLIYQNDRYGTTIDYPNIFKAQPPPDNDDGLKFKTADGADFAVSASYNALDFDRRQIPRFHRREGLAPGAVVTYRGARRQLVRRFRNEGRQRFLRAAFAVARQRK